MPITEHDEPSLADHVATNTTPPPPVIDAITRRLQEERVEISNRFCPKDKTVNSSPYFPAIIRCIYDLLEDRRGTVSAKAWITS